jgi:hypothetical protein
MCYPQPVDTEERPGRNPGRLWSQRAVAAGFEPAEGLHPHTLSRSAQQRTAMISTMRHLGDADRTDAGDHRRTPANETTTETTLGGQARPTHSHTAPSGVSSEASDGRSRQNRPGRSTRQVAAGEPAQGRHRYAPCVSDFQFDVALSFAGEDRLYVSRVAEALKAKKIRVFYDEFEVAQLWGQDLYERLDEIYRVKSRYAMIFASESYTRKMWTNHERRSAQARTLEEKGPYLLPVRLDKSEIPGLRSTLGYLDGSTHTPEEIANLFEHKLKHDGNRQMDHQDTHPDQIGVPLTDREKQLLLSVRPSGWEYLLFAGGTWQALNALEHKYLDHELRYARIDGNHLPNSEIFEFVSRQIGRLSAIVVRLEVILGPDAQLRAFGDQGEPGDPIRIEHLSKRFGDLYEEIMDWAAEMRGTSTNSEFRHALELLARHADSPIESLRDYSERIVAEIGRLPEYYAEEDGEPIEITLAIQPEFDSGLQSDLEQELVRAWNAVSRD